MYKCTHFCRCNLSMREPVTSFCVLSDGQLYDPSLPSVEFLGGVASLDGVCALLYHLWQVCSSLLHRSKFGPSHFNGYRYMHGTGSQLNTQVA